MVQRVYQEKMKIKDAEITNRLTFQGTDYDPTVIAALSDVTTSAAELNTLDGITATTAELNAGGGNATAAVITIGDEVNDVINVSVQLNDANDDAIAAACAIRAYLSDSADGSDLAATAPNGGVVVGTDGIAIPVVAGKYFELITDTVGIIDLDIEESGTDTWYLVLILPNGTVVISDAITFAGA